MKKRRFLLFVLLISQFFLSAQKLSDSIYQKLEQYSFRPVKQSLVNSGNNDFSYNITVDFPSQKESQENLILYFFQEDFNENSDSLLHFLSSLKNKNFDFNVKVVFSFGDNPKISKQGMVFGNMKFLSSINSDENYTAFIFNLNSDKDSVIANSYGQTAPSWLIKNEFDAYIKAGLQKNLPFIYLSQIYSYNFFFERLLTDFFNSEIPAVKLNLKNDISQDTLNQIIEYSINAFANTENKSWDHHFLMIRNIDHYLNLTESITLKIIIVIVFVWLLFIFTLIFINVNQKRFAWQMVKKVIYVVPVTYILIYLSFFLVQMIFKVLENTLSSASMVYTLTGTQIFTSMITLSIFYLLVLLSSDKFETASIDYLILFCSFINQSLFILVDISLFPIFMLICFLSILSLSVKNNIVHIIIFLLMIFPFIPYGHYIVSYSNLDSLKVFLLNNNFTPLAFCLVLTPVGLVYLRILTPVKKEKSLKITIIGISISILTVLFLLLLTSLIRIPQIKKSTANDNEYKIINFERQDDLIEISCNDKYIFDYLIRTLNISVKDEPVMCDVRIICQDENPVLYSDYDFEIFETSVAAFKIPQYPPQNMTFSYGASNSPCKIKVSALYETETVGLYKSTVKVLSVGE